MPRTPEIEPALIEHARQTLATARTIEQLRQAQSVLLPALMKLSVAQTAESLGVSPVSVHRLRERLRRDAAGEHPPPGRGGRRNALLSPREEARFLAPWARQARAGALKTISALREALARELGRAPEPTVAYRMLARHGWRKLAGGWRPKDKPPVRAARPSRAPGQAPCDTVSPDAARSHQ
jgi:transposase